MIRVVKIFLRSQIFLKNKTKNKIDKYIKITRKIKQNSFKNS